jgi:SpoVK/Ycf46/Vps4 family AAA+-type ATPase
MDEFLEFLKSYRERQHINYYDVINIVNAANYNYYSNNLCDIKYTGLFRNLKQDVLQKKNKKDSKNKNVENPYSKVNPEALTPKQNNQNYYSFFNNSSWNKCLDDKEFMDILDSFKLLGIEQRVDVNSTYEQWQKKHEIVIDLNKKENPQKDQTETSTEKKEKVTLNVKIENLEDMIKIIDENPYDKEKEYNIDLCSLHKIRGELVELNNMIGMKTLKTAVVNQLIYFMQGLHIMNNGSSDFLHTVICGPPGTGKTEVAKIIGRMYSKVGILKKNVFKKVTRSDLVAGYLGQTAIKTKNIITECLGGCLFIDEAYSLASASDDLDSYSKECIDTLCEALSNHKDNLMVIIAGYENELNETFFRANRGLESRFIWRFKIDSYSPLEMKQIFEKKVRETGWVLIDETILKDKWFEKKKDDFKYFGRDMELLFSHIKVCHSRRVYGLQEDVKKKITLEDMDNGFKVFTENLKKKEKGLNSAHYGLYL